MATNELYVLKFRVNAVFDNDNVIRIMGYRKDKGSTEKEELVASIWKTKKDGSDSKAYLELKKLGDITQDLLVVVGIWNDNYNDKKQFTIRVIKDRWISQFKDENGKYEPKQKEKPTSTKNVEKDQQKMLKPKKEEPEVDIDINDVPWEIDL